MTEFLVRHITRKAIQSALNQAIHSQDGSGRGYDQYTIPNVGNVIARAYFDGFSVETSHYLDGVRITPQKAVSLIEEYIDILRKK